MKKYVIFLLLMLPLALTAQQKSFKLLFDKYSGRDGYTTVGISADMLKMVYSFSGEESDHEMTKLINDIKGISIVVTERMNDEFIDDIEKMIDKYVGLKTVTSINEGGQVTRIFIVEKDTITSEFLMVSYGKQSNVVINIVGNVDVKQISRLSDINISGMDQLEDTNDKKE
jgi:aromatic ring hydroxylase